MASQPLSLEGNGPSKDSEWYRGSQKRALYFSSMGDPACIVLELHNEIGHTDGDVQLIGGLVGAQVVGHVRGAPLEKKMASQH